MLASGLRAICRRRCCFQTRDVHVEQGFGFADVFDGADKAVTGIVDDDVEATWIVEHAGCGFGDDAHDGIAIFVDDIAEFQRSDVAAFAW